MTNLLIFDAFTLLICEKNVANYALLRCKNFSRKIWLRKILDKYHICAPPPAKWTGCKSDKRASQATIVLPLLVFPLFYRMSGVLCGPCPFPTCRGSLHRWEGQPGTVALGESLGIV